VNINNGVLEGVRRIGARVRDLTVDGAIPGAPLGFRLRGANTSGHPTTGTWKAGDETRDRSGIIWICTAGGTPGTWVQSGLLPANNLSDLGAVSTAQVNLGLGSAAVQSFVPTYYENNAGGGTSGTTATTGNTGSTSGTAFGGVTGTVTFDNSETLAAGSSTLAYKLVGSASTAYVTWTVPNTASPTPVQYSRVYFYLSATSFSCDLLAGPGLDYRVTYTSGGQLYVRAAPGSSVTGITTLAASTWYRLENAINQAAGTHTAKLYNVNGVLLETMGPATGGTYLSNTTAYFGSLDAYTGTIWLAYPAWSNAGWIGP
jgi:hypothetical protein